MNNNKSSLEIAIENIYKYLITIIERGSNMTWSELLNQPKILPPDYEIHKWQQEAIEFGDKYNVIIRLKGSHTRCGEQLIIEMYHPNDPKNIVRYKKDGTCIGSRDRISDYFEHLYEKLPIVRRRNLSKNKRIKED